MKGMIKARFPGTRLFLGEFVPCPDGKYRYFSKHRIEMYKVLLEEIRRYAPEAAVYLCMEADHVWRKVFGHLPEEVSCLGPVFEPRQDRE
ncbi:MAG: SPL family radical SAM protein, partial [Planctomycetota bacterium]|jgi:hypothetical protein